MKLKFTTLGAVALGLFSSALSFAGDFTQKDLEAMVKGLDPFMVHNPDYLYPVDCEVVDKDEVNAYATVKVTPDKKLQSRMVVFTGLVKFAKNDLRLVRAVVAHELSHLSKGHIGNGMRPKDLDILLTRQQEFEADITGASVLQAAGYSKQDMVDMLMMLRQTEADVPWLRRQTGDHASCATRAAEVAGNPLVMRSLVDFEAGVAYMQCRSYTAAMDAFDRAVVKEPKLQDAYTDSAQAALMRYYDYLPTSVKESWLRPDFGPTLVPPQSSKAVKLGDEDRQRYKDAAERAVRALKVNGSDRRAQEIVALALALDPDGDPEKVATAAEGFRSLLKSSMDDKEKLRLANNLGVALQRISKLQEGLTAMLDVQSKTTFYNEYIALNLGMYSEAGEDKTKNELALAVVGTWLLNGGKDLPEYDAIHKTYLSLCKKLSLEPKEFESKPIYISQVTTIHQGDYELSILEPLDSILEKLGKAESGSRYSDKFPDMLELCWQSGNLRMLTERDAVMRVTSYSPGAYFILRPQKASIQAKIQIEVGMSVDDFNNFLDISRGTELELVRGGEVEKWVYFGNLGFGVFVKDKKIAGITATPARTE